MNAATMASSAEPRQRRGGGMAPGLSSGGVQASATCQGGYIHDYLRSEGVARYSSVVRGEKA